MYTQGSVEFNELIETPNNQALVKRLILTDDNTEIENIVSIIMHSSSSQDELQIGTTNMSYIEVVAVTDKVLTNREVRLECGVKLSNGTIEYAPMGVFTIQKPQGDLDRITFTANDKMQKFEKPYVSSLTYPTTSDKVLAELCNMCGVELATPIDTPITIATKLDGYTCREMLGYISGIHAKFACFDRLGKLNLRWYSNAPIDKNIGLIYKFSKAERNFTVDKVEVAKDSETNFTSGDGLGVVYYSNPLATQDITNNILNKINGFTYNASTVEILDDIRLDLGDVIKVTYLDGIDYLVPCMSLKQDFAQGSTSIEAYSKTDEENEYRYTGPTTRYIERVAHELLLANRIIATKVDADYVQSHAITTDNLDAIQANITTLVVEEIDGRYANLDFANIDVANINVTKMGELFAKVGLIDRATIVDGHITGFLDAVEINANKITAGTLIADRILLSGGEKGVLYALNNLGELTSTNVNSLDGYVLTDRTITADKIIAKSITTNELDVANIFGNTAVLNTIVSQDIFAQAVATNSLVVGAYGVAEEALKAINSLEIGGRNLAQKKYILKFAGTTNLDNYISKGEIVQSDNVAHGGFRFDSINYYEPDTEYTLSGYICLVSGSIENFYLYNGKSHIYKSFYIDGKEYGNPLGVQMEEANELLNDGESHYFELHFETASSINNDTSTNYTYFQINKASTTFVEYKIKGFKLEKGNKATDWTPAPEDIEADISLVGDIANTTKNTLSNLTLTENNITVIDGGKIATGSITANKIDVLDLFSKNIVATGTITGATLMGTYAEIDEGNIGNWHINDGNMTSLTNDIIFRSTGALEYDLSDVVSTGLYGMATYVTNGKEKVTLSAGGDNVYLEFANVDDRERNVMSYQINLYGIEKTKWSSDFTSSETKVILGYLDDGIYTPNLSADRADILSVYAQNLYLANLEGRKATFSNTVTAPTFSGIATKVHGTVVKPTSESWYFPVFCTGASSGGKTLNLAGCLTVGYNIGTVDTDGRITLNLGNNIASGTDKNARGCIRMYDTTKYYANIYFGNGDTTANKNIYFPKEGGTVAMTTSNVASATKIYSTLTNPTAATTYVIPFCSSASTGNKSLLNNDGILYKTMEGTTTTNGYGLLFLGNNTASGTAKNKYGVICMYGNGGYYTLLRGLNATANRTINFPDASGTVALESKFSDYLPLSGGNLTGALTLNNAIALNGKNTSGTVLNLIAINSSNRVVVGNTSCDTYINGGTAYISGSIVLNNNKAINMKNTNNEYVNCMYMDNTNSLRIGYGASDIRIGENATTSTIYTYGKINTNNNIVLPNNSAILFKNTSGAEVNSLFMGIDNVLYLGYDSKQIIIGKALQNTGLICGIEFVYSSNDTKLNIKPVNVSNYATYLGDATYYYNTIYYQTLSQISDRNSKKDIFDISEKYLDLWDKLSVKTFRYIDDDKTVKVGLIAQEVEECALKSGLTLEQCGFILREYVDNEIYKGYKYSLDYTGLATITMAKLKQVIGNIAEHDKRIQRLEDEIAILKATISQMQMQYA